MFFILSKFNYKIRCSHLLITVVIEPKSRYGKRSIRHINSINLSLVQKRNPLEDEDCKAVKSATIKNKQFDLKLNSVKKKYKIP